jgi:hypothetical protein
MPSCKCPLTDHILDYDIKCKRKLERIFSGATINDLFIANTYKKKLVRDLVLNTTDNRISYLSGLLRFNYNTINWFVGNTLFAKEKILAQ